jgi:hypothetical protein
VVKLFSALNSLVGSGTRNGETIQPIERTLRSICWVMYGQGSCGTPYRMQIWC